MGDPIATDCPPGTVFSYDAEDLKWAEAGVPFWPYRATDDDGYPISPEKWLAQYAQS